MSDGVDEAARMRFVRAKEVSEAEALIGWLAVVTIPIGLLFARRKS